MVKRGPYGGYHVTRAGQVIVDTSDPAKLAEAIAVARRMQERFIAVLPERERRKWQRRMEKAR